MNSGVKTTPLLFFVQGYVSPSKIGGRSQTAPTLKMSVRTRRGGVSPPWNAVYTNEENYDWLFSFTNAPDKDLSEQISVD